MAYRIVIMSEPSSETEGLRDTLTAKGHSVVVSSPAEMETFRVALHDIILTGGPDAIGLCERLLGRDSKSTVVVLDAEPNMRSAVAALRAGAADFVTDPSDPAAVDAAIQRVTDKRLLSERLNGLGGELLEAEASRQELLGDSVAMRQVRARIERLKGSEAPLLVLGEKGAGKSAVARLLHEQSPRRSGPFVAVHCAEFVGPSAELDLFGASATESGDTHTFASPFSRARGGTVFLDEIERLPLSAQAKLHRVIEHGTLKGAPVDVRLIAASSVDLSEAVASGVLRQELFARLSVVQIRIPPLRERGLDTLLLAQHFVQLFAAASAKRVVGMTLGAARTLMLHDWPGNVRELRNWVEAAVATTRHDHITESELLANWNGVRSAIQRSSSDDTLMSWNSLEARHIASTLEEAGGNKARAARLLGIDRKTLYRKLERYGLDTPDRQRREH